MDKSRTKQAPRKPRSWSETLSSESKLTLPEVLLDARRLLRELVLTKGPEVFGQLLEEDRTARCGPKNKPQEKHVAYRHGHDEGQVVLGGRKVLLSKPRVRSLAGEELELAPWRETSHEDPLSERVIARLLVGVSTRNYARSPESVP